jgi:hypothetical protein
LKPVLSGIVVFNEGFEAGQSAVPLF